MSVLVLATSLSTVEEIETDADKLLILLTNLVGVEETVIVSADVLIFDDSRASEPDTVKDSFSIFAIARILSPTAASETVIVSDNDLASAQSLSTVLAIVRLWFTVLILLANLVAELEMVRVALTLLSLPF